MSFSWLTCHLYASSCGSSVRCDTGRIIIHKYKRQADARLGAALIVRSRSDATAASTPSDNEERLCPRTRSRRSAPCLAMSRRVRSGSASKRHETLRQIREAEMYTRSMLRTCVTIQHWCVRRCPCTPPPPPPPWGCQQEQTVNQNSEVRRRS